FHGLRPALCSPNISADHPRCAVRLACEPGCTTRSPSSPGIDHQPSCGLTTGRLLDDDGRANRDPLVEEGHGAEGHIDAAVGTVREVGPRTVHGAPGRVVDEVAAVFVEHGVLDP